MTKTNAEAGADAIAAVDFGTSTTKALLCRNGVILAHFIVASCEKITQEDYERELKSQEQDPPTQWGTGAVKLMIGGNLECYRVGLSPVSQTSEFIEKWKSAIVKMICILGWLGQSSSSDLRVKLKALLPIDERIYKEPMMGGVLSALSAQPEVNGSGVKNIKVFDARLALEGAGFCTDNQISAGVEAGHCDVSFAIGSKGAVDRNLSFTLSGAGVILPLTLSGLPCIQDEVTAAIALSRKNWKYFVRPGLTESHIEQAAKDAIEAYLHRQEDGFRRIGRICEKHRIQTLSIGGGNARMIAPLLKNYLPKAIKLVGTGKIEEQIMQTLGISDRSKAARLVDLFKIAAMMPQFRDVIENGPIQPTVKEKRASEVTIDA
jgi:hypothetical protein